MKSDQEKCEKLFCPVEATISLLNQRWTLHIVEELLQGRKRFNELAREIGVIPTTLRDRLKNLEEQNVVKRIVISEMPPNVEYELTEKGLALNRVFESLAAWGREWMPKP